jgi:hypothetical protein
VVPTPTTPDLHGESLEASLTVKDLDTSTNRIHRESAAVKKFAGILYPNCLAPVEFIEYKQIDANATFRRAQ